MKAILTDQQIIKAIRSGNLQRRDAALKELYNRKELLAKITAVVGKHEFRHHDIDPKNYLGEALCIFEDDVLHSRYDPRRSSVSTYIIGIVKNRHYTEKRSEERRKIREQIATEQMNQNGDSWQEKPVETHLRREMLKQYLAPLLQALGKNCHDLLLTFTLTGKELAEKLGYRSPDSVKSAKADCLRKLRQFLRTHPHVRQTLEDLSIKL